MAASSFLKRNFEFPGNFNSATLKDTNEANNFLFMYSKDYLIPICNTQGYENLIGRDTKLDYLSILETSTLKDNQQCK